jgi:hypothetical protein
MNDINAWKAYTHQLLSAGGTIFANAEIPVTEEGAADIKILGLTLLARTLSHTRGVLTLVDANRVVEGSYHHTVLLRKFVLGERADRRG